MPDDPHHESKESQESPREEYSEEFCDEESVGEDIEESVDGVGLFTSKESESADVFERESEPSLAPTPVQREASAKNIQRVFRGRQSRREETERERAPSPNRRGREREPSPERCEEESAAANIQRVYRGRKARQATRAPPVQQAGDVTSKTEQSDVQRTARAAMCIQRICRGVLARKVARGRVAGRCVELVSMQALETFLATRHGSSPAASRPVPRALERVGETAEDVSQHVATIEPGVIIGAPGTGVMLDIERGSRGRAPLQVDAVRSQRFEAAPTPRMAPSTAQRPRLPSRRNSPEQDTPPDSPRARGRGRGHADSGAREREDRGTGEGDEERAALKIQSLRRGNASRKATRTPMQPARQGGNAKPENVSDDPELEQAATLIQSIHRGRKSRKATQAARHRAPAIPPMRGRVEVDGDPELEQAATKIQSIHRGRKSRKATQAAQHREAPAIPPMRGRVEVDDDLELEQAVTKIQSMHRGRRSRKATLAAKGREAAPMRGTAEVHNAPAIPPTKGPVGIDNDPELEQAATKIQSIHRGRRSRTASQAAQHREAPVVPPMRGRVEIDDDPELEQAATKIQSMHRGRQSRKATRVSKNRGHFEVHDAPAIPLSRGLVEVNDDLELEQAATKIQSIHRGRQSRKASQAAQHREAPAVPMRGRVEVDDDPELQQAATKIQSIHRGRRSRKVTRAAQHRDAPAIPSERGRGELDIDPELEQAATKIQSIHRGRGSRKATRAARDREAPTVPLTKGPVEFDNDPEVERAALKIQSLQRGRQSRKVTQAAQGRDEGPRVQPRHFQQDKEQVADMIPSSQEQMDQDDDEIRAMPVLNFSCARSRQEPHLQSNLSPQESAAVTIQKRHRGKKDRQRVIFKRDIRRLVLWEVFQLYQRAGERSNNRHARKQMSSKSNTTNGVSPSGQINGSSAASPSSRSAITRAQTAGAAIQSTASSNEASKRKGGQSILTQQRHGTHSLDEETACSKIQGTLRGVWKKKEEAKAKAKAQKPKETYFEEVEAIRKKLKSMETQKSLKIAEETAAVHLQRLFRGVKARTEVNHLKAAKRRALEEAIRQRREDAEKREAEWNFLFDGTSPRTPKRKALTSEDAEAAVVRIQRIHRQMQSAREEGEKKARPKIVLGLSRKPSKEKDEQQGSASAPLMGRLQRPRDTAEDDGSPFKKAQTPSNKRRTRVEEEDERRQSWAATHIQKLTRGKQSRQTIADVPRNPQRGRGTSTVSGAPTPRANATANAAPVFARSLDAEADAPKLPVTAGKDADDAAPQAQAPTLGALSEAVTGKAPDKTPRHPPPSPDTVRRALECVEAGAEEQEETAALKIQSAHRRKVAAKEVGQRREAAMDCRRAAAVTKIQAAHRGKTARKNLRAAPRGQASGASDRMSPSELGQVEHPDEEADDKVAQGRAAEEEPYEAPVSGDLIVCDVAMQCNMDQDQSEDGGDDVNAAHFSRSRVRGVHVSPSVCRFIRERVVQTGLGDVENSNACGVAQADSSQGMLWWPPASAEAVIAKPTPAPPTTKRVDTAPRPRRPVPASVKVQVVHGIYTTPPPRSAPPGIERATPPARMMGAPPHPAQSESSMDPRPVPGFAPFQKPPTRGASRGDSQGGPGAGTLGKVPPPPMGGPVPEPVATWQVRRQFEPRSEWNHRSRNTSERRVHKPGTSGLPPPENPVGTARAPRAQSSPRHLPSPRGLPGELFEPDRRLPSPSPTSANWPSAPAPPLHPRGGKPASAPSASRGLGTFLPRADDASREGGRPRGTSRGGHGGAFPRGLDQGALSCLLPARQKSKVSPLLSRVLPPPGAWGERTPWQEALAQRPQWQGVGEGAALTGTVDFSFRF